MFSNTVQLADINDFITPEQECIIQTGSNVKLDVNSLIDDDIGNVKIKSKKNQNNNNFGHFNQIVTTTSNTAKITLNDCLACSGCITSAETILINQQSIKQMETYLTKNKNAQLIITISDQAYISIAKKYNMTPNDALQKISAFFKQEYNAKFIFDTFCAKEIVFKEAVNEFIVNYKRKYIINDNDNNGMDSDDNINANGMDLDLDLDFDDNDNYNDVKMDANNNVRNVEFPIISSECPGFVCYAETSCKPMLLQHISSVKSPQQVMGLFIKQYLFNNTCNDIYHVTIMACYDKKLEASRKQFIINDNVNKKEVDCVITSNEVYELFRTKNINLNDYQILINSDNKQCDNMLDLIDNNNDINYISEILIDRNGSNGYLENIFIAVSKQLFNISHNLNDLKYKKLKNEDIEEVSLILNNSEINNLAFKFKKNNNSILKTGKVLSFLRCFGFRNIQNVVRKIERNKSKYSYIEIMACPYGCLNGGGQIKINNNKLIKQREYIYKLRKLLINNQIFNKTQQKKHKKTEKHVADIIYNKLLKTKIGQNKLLQTTYKHINDNNKTKINIAW